MRLGIASGMKNLTADMWANDLASMGVRAVSFPLDYTDDVSTIDNYVEAARKNDIMIAEVGVWANPVSPVKRERDKAMEMCVEQLKLADYIGAKCCVNYAGANGLKGDAPYPENFSSEFYSLTVNSIKNIIDQADPQKTFYCIEPMPWMVPTGPDEYLKLIADVNRPRLGVHIDIVNWMNAYDRVFFQQRFMDDVFVKLHGRIKSCHLKDFNLRRDQIFQVHEEAIGKGMLDMDYYMQKINAEDPALPLLIEHQGSKMSYDKAFKYVIKNHPGVL